jgi:hypothetical protein
MIRKDRTVPSAIIKRSNKIARPPDSLAKEMPLTRL